MWLLALVLSLCPAHATQSPAPNATQDAIQRVARSPAWLKLLHYGRSFPLWRYKSQVDADGFFLSPEGRTDPEAELRASLDAFADPARRVGKYPAQCAFPVRYAMLKRELGLEIPRVECPEFERFLAKFNTRSATLVFSSAYPSSPASMFGHTFLRINAAAPADGKKMDLLDHGIGYAALVPPNENSFAYAWLGVTGGYPGQFSLEPYYVKVREYNNGESRDLWEYDLSLTQAETVQLISHAWELDANGGFFYYFGTRNCSYQLLALLESVRPEWDLTGYFIHVIPAETIKKVVATPGAVTAVRLRPALRKRVLAGYEALSSPEHEVFEQMLSRKLDPAQVESAAPLDVAVEYLHYRKEYDGGKLEPEDQKLLQQALIRRSRLPQAQGESAFVERADETSRPDMGHYPYRVGLSGGATSTGSAVGFAELNLKMAYHDLLNDDRGYSPYSRIDFPALTLRYRPEDRRLSIEQLLIGALTSLNPMSLVDRKISWHAQLDYSAVRDFGCLDCHVVHAEGAVGRTVPLFGSKAIVTALLHGYVEAGESLTVRGGPKLELSTILHPVAPFKLRLAATGVTDLFQSARPQAYAVLEATPALSLGQSWELRASGIRYLRAPATGEVKLTINRYF